MALEFAGVFPLAAVFSFVAVFLVCGAVLGNYYKDWAVGVVRGLGVGRNGSSGNRRDDGNGAILNDENDGNARATTLDNSHSHNINHNENEGRNVITSVNAGGNNTLGSRTQPSNISSRVQGGINTPRGNRTKWANRANRANRVHWVHWDWDGPERRAAVSLYIDALFLDLDLNLLVIFVGLFIVSGAFVRTGVPRVIWQAITTASTPSSSSSSSSSTATTPYTSLSSYTPSFTPSFAPSLASSASTSTTTSTSISTTATASPLTPSASPTPDPASLPFHHPLSTFLVSLYITLASQLVGNVAVVIMLAGDLSALDDNTQRFGWLLLAWVSTVAGNLPSYHIFSLVEYIGGC
jgi:cell division septation protein DedD